MKGLRHSNIAVIPDLHAKFYMNEGMAVIASMNLYEYSLVNNEELGVLFGRRQDRAMFKDATYQVMRLIDISEKEHGPWNTESVGKPLKGIFGLDGSDTYDEYEMPQSVPEAPPEASEDPSVERIVCHCIRCGHPIPSDHPNVYCGRCFKSWSKWSNPSYVERGGHCYICGKVMDASADRPRALSASGRMRTSCARDAGTWASGDARQS